MKRSACITVTVFLLFYTALGAQTRELSTLAASGLHPHSLFGSSIFVNDKWLVAGAPGQMKDSAWNCGMAVVYQRYGDWIEKQRLTPESSQNHDRFGAAVSVDLDKMIVAAPGDFGGSVYFYYEGRGFWNEREKIKHPEVTLSSSFGSALLVKGNTLLVAAPGHSVTAPDQGVVFQYEFDGAKWQPEATIQAPDTHASMEFGSSLAMTGKFLIIGAPGADGKVKSAGAVYIYERKGDGFRFITRISAPRDIPFQLFGESISADGNYLIVGSKMTSYNAAGYIGAAYIYVIGDNGTVSMEAEIASPDAEEHDFFGHAVCIRNGVAAISAISDDYGDLNDAGSVYLFKKNGRDWIHQHAVIAKNGDNRSAFGGALMMNGSHLAIGSCLAGGTELNIGRVYVEQLSVFELEKETMLAQNYPNPFSGDTDIRYYIAEASDVTLDVFDLTGQRVARLVGEHQKSGVYYVQFESPSLASGIYLLCLTAGDVRITRKMVFETDHEP